MVLKLQDGAKDATAQQAQTPSASTTNRRCDAIPAAPGTAATPVE